MLGDAANEVIVGGNAETKCRMALTKDDLVSSAVNVPADVQADKEIRQ
jgi:hypothetical protein